MSGDYSRKRFDPRLHFSEVLQQQGRVGLDAEANENNAITDRRWRAESIDVIGRCGVPNETPNGFLISGGIGGISIGEGRIYVDGYLAENHGSEPVFSAVLEELYGTDSVPLENQPYWPGDPPVLVNGNTLFYVDVWKRELTSLQIDNLVEPAVGVDTTTRHQTVWQVRVLNALDDDVDCNTPLEEIDGWPEGNNPSAARLTTSTVDVDPKDDPCLIPPSGGNRGLENYLYRLEVHDMPAPDEIRVKWSRENASVATQVQEVLPGATHLRVESVGKDDVLRFKTGSWVEVTNNLRELRGIPGEMRQITVDEGASIFSFAGALPADLSNNPQQQHLRVIRWDQSEGLDADGLIVLSPGDTVVLENGIAATLDLLAGGLAKTADFWCFAGRTVDASIEILDAAAPQGIHHHYCGLAIGVVSGGEVFDLTDCRPRFPPLTEIDAGCCTVVVRPGESIQAAIDSLPVAGGCICLKTGEHVVTDTLNIDRSHVEMHGESPGVVIRRDNGETILFVGSARGDTIEHVNVSMINFDSRFTGSAFAPVVRFNRAQSCQFAHNEVVSPQNSLTPGVIVQRSERIAIERCELANTSIGIWVMSDSSGLLLADNVIIRPADANGTDTALVGIWLRDAFGASIIKQNRISGYQLGIRDNHNNLNSDSAPRSSARGLIVRDNSVSLQGPLNLALEEKFFALDIASPLSVITGNRVTYNANYHGGIRANGSLAQVKNNTLNSTSTVTVGGGNRALAIQYGVPDDLSPLTHGDIMGNDISGLQHGILLLGASGCRVKDNTLDFTSGPHQIAGIVMVGVNHTTVTGNHIINGGSAIGITEGAHNQIDDNQLRGARFGILILEEVGTKITGNSLEAISSAGVLGLLCSGEITFSDNLLKSCGFALNSAHSVYILGITGELHVESNQIINTGISPDQNIVSDLAIGLRCEFILQCQIQSNHIGYEDSSVLTPGAEHRALLLQGLIEAAITFGAGEFVFGFAAQVLDNKFVGPGNTALVEFTRFDISDDLVSRFERVLFNNNYCHHQIAGATSDSAATVQLRGRRGVVQGNQFKAFGRIPPVNFHSVRSVYLGNVAMASPINFVGKPDVLSDFNII